MHQTKPIFSRFFFKSSADNEAAINCFALNHFKLFSSSDPKGRTLHKPSFYAPLPQTDHLGQKLCPGQVLGTAGETAAPRSPGPLKSSPRYCSLSESVFRSSIFDALGVEIRPNTNSGEKSHNKCSFPLRCPINKLSPLSREERLPLCLWANRCWKVIFNGVLALVFWIVLQSLPQMNALLLRRNACALLELPPAHPGGFFPTQFLFSHRKGALIGDGVCHSNREWKMSAAAHPHKMIPPPPGEQPCGVLPIPLLPLQLG